MDTIAMVKSRMGEAHK